MNLVMAGNLAKSYLWHKISGDPNMDPAVFNGCQAAAAPCSDCLPGGAVRNADASLGHIGPIRQVRNRALDYATGCQRLKIEHRRFAIRPSRPPLLPRPHHRPLPRPQWRLLPLRRQPHHRGKERRSREGKPRIRERKARVREGKPSIVNRNARVGRRRTSVGTHRTNPRCNHRDVRAIHHTGCDRWHLQYAALADEPVDYACGRIVRPDSRLTRHTSGDGGYAEGRAQHVPRARVGRAPVELCGVEAKKHPRATARRRSIGIVASHPAIDVDPGEGQRAQTRSVVADGQAHARRRRGHEALFREPCERQPLRAGEPQTDLLEPEDAILADRDGIRCSRRSSGCSRWCRHRPRGPVHRS